MNSLEDLAVQCKCKIRLELYVMRTNVYVQRRRSRATPEASGNRPASRPQYLFLSRKRPFLRWSIPRRDPSLVPAQITYQWPANASDDFSTTYTKAQW